MIIIPLPLDWLFWGDDDNYVVGAPSESTSEPTEEVVSQVENQGVMQNTGVQQEANTQVQTQEEQSGQQNQQFQIKRSGGTKWLWIGAGILFLIIIIAIAIYFMRKK